MNGSAKTLYAPMHTLYTVASYYSFTKIAINTQCCTAMLLDHLSTNMQISMEWLEMCQNLHEYLPIHGGFSQIKLLNLYYKHW